MMKPCLKTVLQALNSMFLMLYRLYRVYIWTRWVTVWWSDWFFSDCLRRDRFCRGCLWRDYLRRDIFPKRLDFLFLKSKLYPLCLAVIIPAICIIMTNERVLAYANTHGGACTIIMCGRVNRVGGQNCS